MAKTPEEQPYNPYNLEQAQEEAVKLQKKK
jgi:hypothetical protein